MPESIEEFKEMFRDGSNQKEVFEVLEDKQWHCRECDYDHVNSGQLAGGGGIQGLQRGNRTRPGISIESSYRCCYMCGKRTRQDRWTGEFITSVNLRAMPREFINRTMRVFDGRDVVESTKRPPNQLTIDHKLPMIRWNVESSKRLVDYNNMDEDDIREHFQLLKKSNGRVSHNLLKSRACEHCFETGERGTPFGIIFFYTGGPRWSSIDKRDPNGCEGCGWYDFDLWRKHLNRRLIQLNSTRED